MKNRQSLQKKAIFIVAGILFVILSINTSVLTTIAYKKYKLAILSKTSAIGEALQRELGKVLSLDVPLDTIEGFNIKLKDLTLSEESIGYALVVDTSGMILFHNDQRKVGSILGDNVYKLTASANKALTQTIRSFYNLSFPLFNAPGQIVGVIHIGVKAKAINRQLFDLLSWALIISALCFLLSLGLIYFFISHFITKPILVMEKAADRIASGELTYVIDVKRKDEVASLGNAINRLASNLKDMIVKIGRITGSISHVTSNIVSMSQDSLTGAAVQQAAVENTKSAILEMDNSIIQVAVSTENLSDSSGNASASISEMTRGIEMIAEHANTVSDATDDTVSSIEEMIRTIKSIAESLENLSVSSEEISSSISEVSNTTKSIEKSANESVALAEAVMKNASEKGMKAVGAASEGMSDIKKSIGSLSDFITMLAHKTDEIGKILNVITEVADQTNILALNAAILSAKAGEYGKGFSVVAEEMKSLAESTSGSTMEITALVESIQNMTQSSTMKASESLQTVDNGLALVKDVNRALIEIISSSKASTDMAKAIEKATAEETLAINHINESVTYMINQTENISRAINEQSKGSTFIIETTDKMKTLFNQVKTATDEQKKGSVSMNEVIGNVREQSCQIADAIGKQKEKNVEIVESMKEIRNTTDKLIVSSHEINTAIKSLQDEASSLIEEIEKFKV